MIDILWKATEAETFESFLRMTDEEAKTFFDRYLEFGKERLVLLNRKFYQTGGGNESDLDFEPDSLLYLWRWATKYLHRRDYSRAELEEIMSLPESFRDDRLKNRPLAEDSLILINDIAFYFAEVVIRSLEGVHWQVCRTKIKRYVDRNQPVLGGFSAPGFELGINPRDWVKIAALKTLDGEAGDEALLELYEKCFDLVEGEKS